MIQKTTGMKVRDAGAYSILCDETRTLQARTFSLIVKYVHNKAVIQEH